MHIPAIEAITKVNNIMFN